MFRILFLFTLVTSMSGRRLLQTEMGGGGGAAGGVGAMGDGVPGSQSDSIGNSDNTVGLRMLFGHGATNEGDHDDGSSATNPDAGAGLDTDVTNPGDQPPTDMHGMKAPSPSRDDFGHHPNDDGSATDGNGNQNLPGIDAPGPSRDDLDNTNHGIGNNNNNNNHYNAAPSPDDADANHGAGNNNNNNNNNYNTLSPSPSRDDFGHHQNDDGSATDGNGNQNLPGIDAPGPSRDDLDNTWNNNNNNNAAPSPDNANHGIGNNNNNNYNAAPSPEHGTHDGDNNHNNNNNNNAAPSSSDLNNPIHHNTNTPSSSDKSWNNNNNNNNNNAAPSSSDLNNPNHHGGNSAHTNNPSPSKMSPSPSTRQPGDGRNDCKHACVNRCDTFPDYMTAWSSCSMCDPYGSAKCHDGASCYADPSCWNNTPSPSTRSTGNGNNPTTPTPSTPSTPPTTDTGLVGAANCGAGTVWKEDPGFCVATPEALLHLCKIARGEQWAWTCEHLCSVK